MFIFQLDEEREKEKDAALMQQLEREFDDFEDEFLKEYRQKRIEEMRRAMNNVFVKLHFYSSISKFSVDELFLTSKQSCIFRFVISFHFDCTATNYGHAEVSN